MGPISPRCGCSTNVPAATAVQNHFHSSYCHVDPALLRTVQVDAGAIKFILQGADIMSPGLTSSGGQLPEDLLAGAIVVRWWGDALSINVLGDYGGGQGVGPECGCIENVSQGNVSTLDSQ